MLAEMDMGVSCGQGAGPVIWGVHIHECPKRAWTAGFEHVACVGNGPRKTTSMGRQARGPLHSSAGLNTGLLASTAWGFHPISVPGQFSDPFPLNGMTNLPTCGTEFILSWWLGMANTEVIKKMKRKYFLSFTC